MELFQHSPKRFLIWFCLTFPTAVLIIIVFNILVDPYDIFHIVSIPGINIAKPYVADHLRIQKAHEVKFFNPTAVIFGTSRSELGIDPEHPAFKKLGYKAYDMGMSGSGLYEIYHNLQHAYYATNKKLKLAIIELDPFMFAANREKIIFSDLILDYDENRLLSSSKQSYLTNTFLYDADAILFKTALRASLQTVLNQDSKELYQTDGMRNQEKNGMAIRIVTTGPRREFIDNEKYYMDKVWTIGRDHRYCTSFLGEDKSTFDTFRKIIEFSRANNIEIHFFTSPSHVRYILSFKEAGLWDAFEEFKKGIVNILAEDAQQYPNSKQIMLWDFMNFNSITTEPVPKSVQAKMRWHWEVSHFKKAAGNLVLDRVLGFKDDVNVLPADFGVPLTKNNVQFQLQKTLHDSEVYSKKYPEYLVEIKKSANAIFNNRPGTLCTNAYKLYYEANQERDHGHESKAIVLLNEALKLQKEEQYKAKIRHLPYREISLSSLIQNSLVNDKIKKSLSSWIDYQDRGNNEMQYGDLESADFDFSQAIKQGPAINYLHGIMHMQHKEYQEAVKDFKTILEYDPENKTIELLLEHSQARILLMEKKDRNTLLPIKVNSA